MRERIFTDTGQIDQIFQYVIENDHYIWSAWYQWMANHQYSAMQDVEIPDFHRRSKQGELFCNPMISTTQLTVHRPNIYKGTGLNGGSTASFLSAWDPINPSSSQPTWTDISELLDELESERDVAVQAAWANVDISEMQALASLGELPETIKWIGSLYTRMINVIRMFKRKQLGRNVRRFLKSTKRNKIESTTDFVSNFWLELRYAVRPLVFEMAQAVTALKTAIDKAQRLTARGKHVFADQGYAEGSYVDQYQATRTQKHWHSISASFRAGVLYRIEDDVNKVMSVWGLNQPIATVWELTPFSFIMDWFFSIGNMISSWEIDSSLTALLSWATEQVVYEDHYAIETTAWNNWMANSSFETVQVGTTTTTRTYKRRIPNPARYSLPHGGINLNAAKILDLAFIGSALFSGCVPDVAKRN